MNDLSFTSDEERVIKVPMDITGLCSGRQALAQRVMTMLLSSTEDPARTYAVGILQDVGRSNIRSPEDMQNDFDLAANTIREIIETEQTQRSGLEPDEILQDIIIDNIRVNGTTVSVDVQVVTESGEDLKASLDI